MCAERGEGPSLLGVLECLFPLGHCSLNTGCRNMAHSSNSTAWLREKQEKDFPGRNLLSNEMLYLACGEGEKIEEPGVGLGYRLEGFNNSFSLCGDGWQCFQILPRATSPLEGAGKSRVQLHLGMAQSCCSAVNAEFVESLAVLYVYGCTVLPRILMGLCPCSG